MKRLLALILAVGMMIAACVSASAISTGADGLRTFEWRQNDRLCQLFAIASPVDGVLRGQQGAHDPVWLEAADSRHLSVVWPAGFTLSFRPDAELRDERGDLVAREGDRLELSQTRWDDATGRYEDPYIAAGGWAGRCYPYTRS